MSEIGQKIKELRKRAKMSQEELGHAIGISRQSVTAWETGKAEPDSYNVRALAEALNTTAAYLLGEAEPTDSSDKFLLVPVVEIEACAGNGHEYPEYTTNVISMRPIPKTDLIGHSWQGSGFKIFTISGDSMEPRFHDGDDVLVSVDETVTTGSIVVAWWHGKLYIRGFIERPGMVILKPLNAKYSQIEIEKGDSELYIIGRVIARVPKIERVDGIF